MKKALSLILATALLLPAAQAAQLEEASPASGTYPGYADVSEGDWFYDNARLCYETGLMSGTDLGFAPGKTLTISELAAITARLRSALTEVPLDPTAGPDEPWYQPYFDYLDEKGQFTSSVYGLVSQTFDRPQESASRWDLLYFFASAIDGYEDQFPAINGMDYGDLPDIGQNNVVLFFYNAGILTGTDQWGTFAGDRSLTRAECAAMVSRLVRPELRLTFSPADYGPFTAASMEPGDILFQSRAGAVTAGDYLPYVVARIGELETVCTEEGVEFNWFHTWGEETFLDYVKNAALTHFGVTRGEGTDLYQNFDLQVFYSRLLDLRGVETSASL